MSSISQSTGNVGKSNVGKRKAIFIAVAPAVIAVLIFIISWIVQLGAAAQARVEYRREAEMAGDNRVFCEKWGLYTGSPKHQECAADIRALSDRQHKRRMQDALPL